MARRADVAGELRVDFAELGDFVHGGRVDFFLGVEACTHGPFVEEMEERAGFDEANGFGIGEQVEGDFGRDATVEEFVFCGPGFVHGTVVKFLGTGISLKKFRSDVVGIASIGQREQWARAGYHAMALVLAVGGVADFFGEGVIGMLQGAHHGRVDADVQSFEAVEIAGGIEQAVDGFGIAAGGFRETDDGAVGFGHDARCVRGIINEARSLAFEFRVELGGEGVGFGLSWRNILPLR